MPPALTLTTAELAELCSGLTQPAAMLRRLHDAGFHRARIEGGKVVLERAHYESVCRGEYGHHAARERPRLELENIR